MHPLRTGEGRQREVGAGREGWLHLHLQTLAYKPLHAREAMKTLAPVPPITLSMCLDFLIIIPLSVAVSGCKQLWALIPGDMKSF
jgi:hypothetical protein